MAASGTPGYIMGTIGGTLLLSVSSRRSVIDMDNRYLRYVIDVSPAERWMDRPFKVTLSTPTPNGSVATAFYVDGSEASELAAKLAALSSPPTDDVRARILAAPKGGCVCTPHWQDAGAGYTEFVPEYEPDCPEHSYHLYDPRRGEWIIDPRGLVTDAPNHADGGL